VFIVETLQGEPIGTMGLHHINLKDRNATTGAMFDKKFCGLGLGTDAKLYLLEYCFMELNLHRVVSSVIEYNKRSLRYSLRCGYKIEGRSKEEVFKEGKYRDVIHLAIFRKDWERVFNRYLKTGRVR
jgi:RimJ/RimL family protein N-acetyltransferase